jgi:hypothetical protein
LQWYTSLWKNNTNWTVLFLNNHQSCKTKRLNQFALALCHRFGIPEFDFKGWPANIFKMNTSIATLSVQGGEQTTIYLEGTQLEPKCFSCHVDDKNDPVYHDVWVVYKHVQHPASCLWFQVGNMFTFCKSCVTT